MVFETNERAVGEVVQLGFIVREAVHFAQLGFLGLHKYSSWRFVA
jgi:hypothetical protein